MGQSYAYVTVKDQKCIIESSYSERFVEDLKRLVPSIDRSWDPEQKTWTVNIKHLPTVKSLVNSCYGKAYLIEGAVTTNLKTGEGIEQTAMF